MNARQAFGIAQSSAGKDLEPIIDKISKQAKEGKYELHIYEILNDTIVSKLKNLGYHIAASSYRNEPLTTISWHPKHIKLTNTKK